MIIYEQAKKEIIKYVKTALEKNDINEGVISHTLGIMERNRCPLSHTNDEIYDLIVDAINDYTLDNDLLDEEFDIDLDTMATDLLCEYDTILYYKSLND